jgi:hypothetical protein
VTRSATDVIRRGIELTLRNWPLLLIRIAEQIIATMLIFGAIVAIIVPIAVSAGLGKWDLQHLPDNPAEVVWTLFIEHWLLVAFVIGVMTVLFGVIIALHSFVQAGATDVYLDGTFSGERWLRGGARGWWRVFWIYNLGWLVASVIVLIPLLPIAAIVGVGGANAGSIALSCLLLALWFFIALLVSVFTAVWVLKAIVLCMRRNLGARESLADARRVLRLEPAVHAAVAFIIFVFWIGGLGLFGFASAGMSFGGHHGAAPFELFFAPAQLAVSLVQTVWSVAAESCFLASFTAIE